MSTKIPGTTIGGLVLVSLGLSITLYKTTLEAYSVFTTATSLGQDVSFLHAELLIQQERLKRWGDGLGLSGETNEPDERLNSETSLFQAVVAALASIRLILTDLDDLTTLYGVDVQDETTAQRPLLEELAATKLMDSEALLRNYDRRLEDAKGLQKRLSIMKKLHWVIRDKEKFEGLIQKLTKFNDGLYSLLSPLDAQLLAEALAAQLLRTTNLERLMALKAAAQRSHVDIASLAELRYRASGLSQQAFKSPNMEKRHSCVSLTTRPTTIFQRRSTGTYTDEQDAEMQGIATLIEWKVFESGLPGEMAAAVERNTNDLAYFLQAQSRSPGLRSLSCIGFIKMPVETAEHVRYGLVYKAPEPRAPVASPTSLYDLLPQSEDEHISHEFDLGDKFRVAQILAQSVYELHVSNWLHKGICSDNVLFWPRKGPKVTPTSAYLSGYEFTRPGRLRDNTQPAGDVASSVYAHPLYREGRVKYHRLFDIYSLGVTLLEIGLWARAGEAVTKETSVYAVQDQLIESCESELGPAMGAEYRTAVKLCLRGDFQVEGLHITDRPEPSWDNFDPREIARLEAADDQVNADLTTEFYMHVVKPLKKLYA
ncbi:hypothetical protein EPUS_05407 [Endocarpon pusillum Z07020]|uniref:Uncharacterized protein n=1 Tax=Endocarpon pusillum (strain Z07020 / HMAS-L-300199) TaxID=1263415 RepID=U1HI46_ENDPU|nr:uncharacterized protein EPUS_05407 [Endocarpon pusillum Z07020]ERF69865.1 hypothetical protein EPUS_05407 [Endocarpon pusillum Z07020]